MCAGLAGAPPCVPHSQVFMGDRLAMRPPCLTGQVGPCGCYISRGTSAEEVIARDKLPPMYLEDLEGERVTPYRPSIRR